MTHKNKSHRASNIRPFYVMDLLARAKDLESQGRTIIHLEVGEPDFATATPIIKAGIKALDELKTHYTPALGIPELRQAIARYYQRKFGIKVDWQRIAITPGASGALQLALAVLANPGQSVLLSDPGYPCNRNIAVALGVNSIEVPVAADTRFQLNAEHVNKYWDEATCAAMVSSPSNPTGTVIDSASMKFLIQAVNNTGGHLIVDEIYQGLIYDDSDYTALSLSDDVFVINSFSKYFGMTGWRLGWMVVPDGYINAIDRLSQNLFLAPATMSQYAALAAFEPGADEILQQRVSAFKQRRDYLLPALESMGFKIPVKPSGAFYIYADCHSITNDSFAWSNELLEQAGVAVTPGIDFGHFESSTHLRFAYTQPVDKLEQAVSKIKTFIS